MPPTPAPTPWRASLGSVAAGPRHLQGRRLLLLGLGTLAALLLLGAPAGAHAAFVSSQPPPGTDLSTAPGVVQLRFTEPLIPELSWVTVTDPLGQTFRGGPSGDTQLQVELQSTVLGPYTVDWKTVSPIDGHTLTGTFQFGVGIDVGAPSAPSDAPRLGDLAVAAARTVEYLGLLGALGLLSLSALADTAGARWRPTGLHRWVLVGAAGGTATVAGEVLLASSGALLEAARGFLLTPTGRVRLVRLGIEVVVVIVATVAVRRSGTGRVDPRPVRALVALLVMGALVAVAAAGHGAAAPYGVWAAAGHLWTAALWAGTILAMAVHRPPGGWRSDLGLRLAREFSPIALAAFAATVVLGLVRAIQELGHLSDLWGTTYGQVLWAKAALVGVMVGLSLRAWRRAQQHAGGEGLAAVGVVVLAAVLVAFPVPPGRAADDPVAEAAADTRGLPQAGDLTLAEAADATVVGLTIRPGEPGINDLFVHLVPSGGDGAGQTDVTLTIEGSTPIQTRTCGDACRVATAPLKAGTTLTFHLTGPPGANGAATFTVPDLPAPDATQLVTTLRESMRGLTSARYQEIFGPTDPPIRSDWALVLPDRLHGTVRSTQYRETIRIADRWWNRASPTDLWVEADGSGGGLSVRVDNFLWDVASTNHRLVGTSTLGEIPVRAVAFFADLGPLPAWFRLWIDDDHRVHRAVMLTQGHFMDQRWYDHNTPITIEPPR